MPKTELSSGLRAGKAQMRTKAEKAFATLLCDYFTDMSDEQKRMLTDKFSNMLRN